MFHMERRSRNTLIIITIITLNTSSTDFRALVILYLTM